MAEVDPSDLSFVRRRSEALDDSEDELTSELPSSVRSEREGLPPGYRMRADRHYVETLTERAARTGTTARTDARPASAKVVPDRSPEIVPSGPASGQMTRALDAIGRDLEAIAESAAVVADAGSAMARRVNADVIRAHTWRAAWLVAAAQMLEEPSPPRLRRHTIGAVLNGVRERFLPEVRMAGFVLDLEVSEWEAAIAADADALRVGVAGALFATLALLDDVDRATIRISGVAGGDATTTIEVVQSDVAAPRATDRVFDRTWTDRPGGWMAATGCAVARAVAEGHGGQAVFLTGNLGSTLRLTLGR